METLSRRDVLLHLPGYPLVLDRAEHLVIEFLHDPERGTHIDEFGKFFLVIDAVLILLKVSIRRTLLRWLTLHLHHPG